MIATMDVIMFHSISNVKSSWSRAYLTVSWKHFERFCKYLSKNNIETVSLMDWYLSENKGISHSGKHKKVVLTFDDGYLDNWIFAYPILKKYGLKGTLFVNPEFIDPSVEMRNNLEDDWSGKIFRQDKSFLGFMNWKEILTVEKSGVLDVQSHSMSHNFYFNSAKVIDVYTGQKKYDWLAWVYRPDRKPFYMTEDQRSYVPFGTPVFEFGRSLHVRRFFPREDFNHAAVEFYQKNLADGTSENDLFKDAFIQYCSTYKAEHGITGDFESDSAREIRYRYELENSKKILETELQKTVEFLCWPGGRYNPISLQMSEQVGYKASTFYSGEDFSSINNTGNYKRIPRIGISSSFTTNTGIFKIPCNLALVHSYKSYTGNRLYIIPLRFFSFIKKIWIGYYFGGRDTIT